MALFLPQHPVRESAPPVVEAIVIDATHLSELPASTLSSVGAAAESLQTWSKELTLRAGDTLSELLSKAGLERTNVLQIVDAIREIYNPRRLQAGQKFVLNFVGGDATAPQTLDGLAFEVATGHTVAVGRDENGRYAARSIIAQTHTETLRFDGVIRTSLFAAAEDQGVPADVLGEMIKLFSYDVDFQREIQPGDSFSLMYDRTVTVDGRHVRTNGIKFAAMNLSGTPLKLYAFQDADGMVEFYNEKGEGVRKALMRTPINGARLTSQFGMRRHPILGYSKMHQGVDFGAPSGTPILAAGDGVIEKREYFGGYGNYIRIRHHSGYSTAYAHLSKFAPDAKLGRRVRQGQVIGYVGSTGRSTAPHLHFEILRNARQVNPMTVKMPASQKLEGAVLAKFKQSRTAIEQQYASLDSPLRLASTTGTQSPIPATAHQ
ncbi:MAG: peptidoglycan DD-metalloendopeptidase family protein [Rhodospirillaceae bacterium]|nr:peptidoglycan DD-metalloendopeptidase family protein [Rhodospirillaceae bacterium]